MDLHLENKSGYSLIRLSGSYAEDEFSDFFADLLKQIEISASSRIVLHMAEVTDTPELFGQHAIADQFASFIRGKYKVALVERTDRMDGFFETSIINRGGNFRTFAEEELARDWLLGEASEP